MVEFDFYVVDVPNLVISSELLIHNDVYKNTKTLGTYNRGTNTITVNNKRRIDELSATLTHELTHAFLHQRGITFKEPKDEEGICELVMYVSFMVLKKSKT
jgi:Zn-dependent peptidase ImmA (M78 family)